MSALYYTATLISEYSICKMKSPRTAARNMGGTTLLSAPNTAFTLPPPLPSSLRFATLLLAMVLCEYGNKSCRHISTCHFFIVRYQTKYLQSSLSAMNLGPSSLPPWKSTTDTRKKAKTPPPLSRVSRCNKPPRRRRRPPLPYPSKTKPLHRTKTNTQFYFPDRLGPPRSRPSLTKPKTSKPSAFVPSPHLLYPNCPPPFPLY